LNWKSASEFGEEKKKKKTTQNEGVAVFQGGELYERG